MFSLLLFFMLFLGQESNYRYNSENIIFTESPAFVATLERPVPTQKTQVPEKTVKIEKKAEAKPFRINVPPYVQGDSSIFGKKVESDFLSIKEKITPPVKIEGRKSERVGSLPGGQAGLPAQAAASGRKVTETVYFDFDSFVLKPEEKAKLDSLSKDTQYRVTGYTCDIGGRGYNDRLALNRARAVQNYLGSIVREVDGKGKCCYVDLKERWRNRRVEIKPLNNLGR